MDFLFDVLSVLLAIPVFSILGICTLAVGLVLSLVLLVSMIFSIPVGLVSPLFKKKPSDSEIKID